MFVHIQEALLNRDFTVLTIRVELVFQYISKYKLYWNTDATRNTHFEWVSFLSLCNDINVAL